MNRIQDERAIVLHSRPYRESSLIVQFLTEGHGRIAAVAKGVRGRKRGHSLHPFYQGLLSCAGRSALVSLHRFDLDEGRWFTGNDIALASYVAELVMRLTKEWEPSPRLFAGVAEALGQLAADGSPVAAQTCLRRFEKLLLEELGYGLDFARDAGTGGGLDATAWYQLVPESGFVAGPAGEGYSGEALLDIDQGCFAAPAVRRAAKAIFRGLLASHLGPAPLLSRRLYRPANVHRQAACRTGREEPISASSIAVPGE